MTQTNSFNSIWSKLSYNYPITFRYKLTTTTPRWESISTNMNYALHGYTWNIRYILTPMPDKITILFRGMNQHLHVNRNSRWILFGILSPMVVVTARAGEGGRIKVTATSCKIVQLWPYNLLIWGFVTRDWFMHNPTWC